MFSETVLAFAARAYRRTLSQGERQDLRAYYHSLRQEEGLHRQQEYLDNLCRKLLSYSLGRTLQLSEDLLVDDMRSKLETNGYRFGSLVERIVISPQFLHKRGRN